MNGAGRRVWKTTSEPLLFQRPNVAPIARVSAAAGCGIRILDQTKAKTGNDALLVKEREEKMQAGEPYKPHPNLSKEINDAIAESELQGGVYLKDVPSGRKLIVQTMNTRYELERRGDEWFIEGNQRFCATPTKCSIHGSTWGGSMIKIGFIGRGMHLEFSTNEYRNILTSEIQEVTEE